MHLSHTWVYPAVLAIPSSPLDEVAVEHGRPLPLPLLASVKDGERVVLMKSALMRSQTGVGEFDHVGGCLKLGKLGSIIMNCKECCEMRFPMLTSLYC